MKKYKQRYIYTNILSILLSLFLLFPWWIAIAIGAADTVNFDQGAAIRGGIFFSVTGGSLNGLIIWLLQLFLMKKYIHERLKWLLLNISCFSFGLLGFSLGLIIKDFLVFAIFTFPIYWSLQWKIIKKNVR